MKKKYYAVRIGKSPGIYNSWPECEKQVKGYSGAEYKSFTSLEEAESFLRSEDGICLEKAIENLDENEMVAYVDGSFNKDIKYYGYGVVVFSKEGKATYFGRENDGDSLEMRNVAGEIKGAMVAMDIALNKNKDTLYLHYDYMGIEKWAKGEWRTNKIGTKRYKEYYDSIKNKLNVVFIKVKAHSGDIYNEEADKLAKKSLGIEN